MAIILKSQLDAENLAVTAELDDLGFYDEVIEGIDVFLVSVGSAYGWQFYGGSGDIHVPCVSWDRLADVFLGRRYASLRDVLRHEYAHAVADLHRGLIRSRKFTDAFGTAHIWSKEWDFDPSEHLSEYAATSPAEDFAETFRFYLKHKGRLPRRRTGPGIRRKWRFVAELSKAVASGLRRW